MWNVAGSKVKSRLILGTAGYASFTQLKSSILRSGAEIVTVSLRRQMDQDPQKQQFFHMLKELGLKFLPNTAGCRSVQEAVTTAHMAREIFDTNWIKLETIGDDYSLLPDPFTLVEATRILIQDGFEVFPYMTDDLVIAARLVEAGCKILMPLAAPISSGQGLLNPYNLKMLRQRYPELTLLIDAGIGAPSHAVLAMEMGFDAIMLNSAVSGSIDPPAMAESFALAIKAGHLAYQAGLMPMRDFAQPSTPVVGTPFWHEAS